MVKMTIRAFRPARSFGEPRSNGYVSVMGLVNDEDRLAKAVAHLQGVLRKLRLAGKPPSTAFRLQVLELRLAVERAGKHNPDLETLAAAMRDEG